jgi:hypothetical protein
MVRLTYEQQLVGKLFPPFSMKREYLGNNFRCWYSIQIFSLGGNLTNELVNENFDIMCIISGEFCGEKSTPLGSFLRTYPVLVSSSHHTLIKYQSFKHL